MPITVIDNAGAIAAAEACSRAGKTAREGLAEEVWLALDNEERWAAKIQLWINNWCSKSPEARSDH